MQPNLCTESLGLSYQRVASQPNGDLSGDHNHDQDLVFNTHRDLVSWSYQNIAMTSHDYPIVQVTNLIILGLSSISTKTW